MSSLRDLFRPADVEIWRKLEAEIGARFREGGTWKRDSIEVTQGDWTVTLDTYFSAASKGEYTRWQALAQRPEGLQFSVYRRGLFSELAKLVGMQDMDIGHPDFDRDFIIQGSDETRIRQIFGDDRIRAWLASQPGCHLLLDREGMLRFSVPGVVSDLTQLKEAFDVFAEILNRLCQLKQPRRKSPAPART